MQQAVSLSHSTLDPNGQARSPAGPRRPWYDLDQAFSGFFYRRIVFVDVAVALSFLGLVLTVSNLNQVNSLTAFLSMRVTVKNVVLLAIFTGFWFLIAYGAHQVTGVGGLTFRQETKAVAMLATVGALPGAMFPLTSVSRAFGWLEFAVFWLGCIGAMVFARALVRVAGNIFGPRLSPVRHCVVVGSGPRAEVAAQTLAHSTEYRYDLVGFVDSGGSYSSATILGRGLLGDVHELPEILKHRVVDEVVVALPVKSCYSDIQSVVSTCERVGVQCRIPSDVFTYSISRPRPGRYESRPGITLDVVRFDSTVFIKRLIDLAGAGIGLALLAPVMACIALVIRFTSHGPAIFAQKRYGYNKRLFKMYKFRTMWSDAEQRQHEFEPQNEMNGPVFKIKDDPRITPVGRILRQSSIDELPQLWNVLNGTMSLVGPRPLPLRDVSRFSDASLMRRFSVKPGLTCLWQISGRNNVDFDRWIELDLEYIDNWSLLLDLKILVRTIGAVIRRSGAA